MCLYLVSLLTATLMAGTLGLRNVALEIQPPVVERGETVNLLCVYDLQGAPLYTVKFYRGTHEFYRYSPNEVPPIKLFPFHGLEVDLSSSRGSSVMVQRAEYFLAGNVSCEVSTDAPNFSTQSASKYLIVVELPKKPPDIHVVPETVAGGLWEAGDYLTATCISPPARPAPNLTWFINDEPALTTSTRLQINGSLEARSVTMTTQLLPRHLTQGSFMVKCTAVVYSVYKETAYRVLGPSSLHEPRHEKVRSSSNSSTAVSASTVSLCILLLVLQLLT